MSSRDDKLSKLRRHLRNLIILWLLFIPASVALALTDEGAGPSSWWISAAIALAILLATILMRRKIIAAQQDR